MSLYTNTPFRFALKGFRMSLLVFALTSITMQAQAPKNKTSLSPKALVKESIDNVLGILDHIHELEQERAQEKSQEAGGDSNEDTEDEAPETTNESLEESIEKHKRQVEDIIAKIFDFNVLARRALGRGYSQFEPEQYEQFVKLFTDLLFDNYYDRITQFHIKEIRFQEEIMLTDSKAEVQSQVIANGNAYPINYRLFKKDNQWRIYDVIVENVSLTSNYRSQLNNMLEDADVSAVLQKLKDKISENEES